MKKLLCILLVLIFAVVLMSSCGDKASDGSNPTEEAPTEALPSDEEIIESILGRWMGEEEGSRLGYHFNADGTGSAAYDVKGDTLTLTKDGEVFELTRFTE